MNSSTYDVVVVGGGAVGLSAAYHCARAGKKVLLLEQFKFFNQRASSKGDSRFFRIMYADPLLCLLAQSAYPLWRELELEAQQTLLTLAPGAWANALLAPLSLRLKLETWHVTYAYYQVDDTRYDYPMWFFFGEPREKDPNLYYGLPPLLTPGRIKAGGDFTDQIYDVPEAGSFEPDPRMLELAGKFLKRTFKNVNPEPTDPQVCMYTMTADHNFVLDFVPGHRNIVLFTGGTGQAFKYTPLLGKILSQLALVGKTEYRIDDFSICRPGVLA